MFGYQVSFKYKGGENMRKSMLGGLFTIIAIGIVLESFVMKLLMVNSMRENDATIQQYDVLVDIDKIKPIYHKESKLSLLHVIRKGGKGNFDYSNIERYIATKFYQGIDDWKNVDEP